MWKPLFAAIGLISLALGAVGIFLPILPTTPFMLLAAFCFARSSNRLHRYLVNHPVFGEYISNYYNHAMTPRHKARTLATLWFGITVSCILIGALIPWIILPTIALLVSIHIIRLQPRPEASPVMEDEGLVEGIEGVEGEVSLVTPSPADHRA
ncbi:Inner membrane protein YbaN [Corynebacterium faecale]|uniref:YbaN family protein n=1 Tax=Corynebacterium faecale TaxID=1758466 RepID=UPI0025B5D75F|nr:YbaN family protein [Corynebacterium faecale]WJY93442.1 Inner membrane protein YbaN [Corynebacterium faecale]